MTQYRTSLPPLPQKMKHLPLDSRGFPIPWFVATIPETGERDFRVADYEKRDRAAKHRLCWVCGGKLGRYLAFVIGPMCACTLTTSEPPCHLDCARYAAMACPFLTQPRMRRNDKGLDEMGAQDAPGLMLQRNPGCACVWITLGYSRFNAGDGRWLIKMDKSESVEWYAEGRKATRAEVQASIDSGYPLLEAEALRDADRAGAMKSLAEHMASVAPLLPA